MDKARLIRSVESVYFKEIPNIEPGQTVKVHLKVVEGEKERIQVFEGLIIALRGSGVSRTMTVRKMSFGIGIERVFPIFSPRIEKIEVIRRGKVRRAKLYYLRGKSTKESRIEQKREE